MKQLNFLMTSCLLSFVYLTAFASDENTYDNQHSTLKVAIQEARLIPDVIAANKRFGYAVSLSGNRALVSIQPFSGTSGDIGAAYIFDFDGSSWSQTAQLAPDVALLNDGFGSSVSLSGDRALVGAVGGREPTPGPGAAYVFELSGGTWSQTAKLLPTGGAYRDVFGLSVSLSGGRALVGAPGNDENGNGSGSAYVFDLNDNMWTQTSQINPTDATTGQAFGFSVSLLGDRLLIGAHNDDDNGLDSGAAYVFDLSAGVWTQSSKLTANDGEAGDDFGRSVSLSDQRALIGARLNDENGINTGAAYIFDQSGGMWSETIKLKSPNTDTDDYFGKAVSLFGNRALVGTNQQNIDGLNTGAAYVFDFAGDMWTQTNILTPSDGQPGSLFGMTLSLSDDRMLIGAFDSKTDGINAGAAYVFFDPKLSISGQVSGLAAGNTVTIENNGYDMQVLNNGPFTFPTSLANGTNYDIKITSQPASSNKTCVVSGGSNNDGTGTLSGANVNDIAITCTRLYSVGGSISGLSAGNSVVIQNNAGDDLTLSTNGSFTFATHLLDGSNFQVTVLSGPVTLNCGVTNPSGTINGMDIDSVMINCTPVDSQIQINSSSIDFGGVSINENQTATLTLSNPGVVDLTINNIVGISAPFSLSGGSCLPTPVTLMPDNSCTVEISFNPNTSGIHNGQIAINSDASNSPTLVDLSGSGTGSGQPTQVPILNTWYLGLLACLMLTGGLIYRRKIAL